MFTSKRLTEVFKSASAKEKEIPIDDSSKLILFSDCHRGDNSWADDFADNQNLFFHALDYYYKKEFTYIEIGDGDELWENKRFEDIRYAHSNIFWKMRQLHRKKRLYLIWGNHNRKWKSPKNVRENLYRYYDELKGKRKRLFKGIEVREGLVLKYSGTENRIFLTHGHQGDLLNDGLWWVGKFVVRKIWRILQIIGVRDPTSPAKNFKARNEIDKNIEEWAKANKQMIIVGHTHQPRFPSPQKPPYFNTGSCVHPRCITGIEIQNGSIVLIKWSIEVNSNGLLFIERRELTEPEKLQSFFV
jgi:UDP-2,3-diacylglucosamine pyrophosphatase LpxH